MMEKQHLRTVRDIGERGLIHQFQKIITPFEKALLEGNEDAVAVPLERQAIVVNSDMLVASTDVLQGMSAAEIAWKTGVMGLSDLAAKGASPYGIIVSLGLPEDTKEDFAIELVKGLDDVCREHDTFYLGGDTNQCSELVINCTAIGSMLQEHLIRRKGAKPGDIVAVSGEFGYTGALFEIIFKDVKSPTNRIKEIRKRALQPKARLREGRILATSRTISAAIDSSDGLAWSLYELSSASKVGFEVDHLPIPQICVDFAHENSLNANDLALYGGEEFELVVIIPSKRWSEALENVQSVGGNLIRIGMVTKKPENVLILDGQKERIEARGFEHFSR